ncbi:MAG: hypothetical protein Q9211_007142, partial [Gyalolechia sp. 1 TL-2023]
RPPTRAVGPSIATVGAGNTAYSDMFQGFFKPWYVSRDNYDVCAFLSEKTAYATAHALGCAGDEDSLLKGSIDNSGDIILGRTYTPIDLELVFSCKEAHKRKASSLNAGRRNDGRDPDQSSKLTINTYEDVADSEDEFFINRDKILLDEGPEQKRRRKLEEDDALLEPSDEEVLPEPSSPSFSGSEASQDDGAFSPKFIPPRISNQGLDYASDASDGPAREEGEQDAYDWGTSRKDYYNADPITTEADALEEEAEARRLQKKQLQGMTEADFGLDEIDWAQAKKEWATDGEDVARGKVISEVLPKIVITDSMGPEEKMQILRLRYPEFEPLAKEYLDLQ